VFLNLVLRDTVLEVLSLDELLVVQDVERLCNDILFRFEFYFGQLTDVVRKLASFVLAAASSFPMETRYRLVGGK
jgi:hypothetical protein